MANCLNHTRSLGWDAMHTRPNGRVVDRRDVDAESDSVQTGALACRGRTDIAIAWTSTNSGLEIFVSFSQTFKISFVLSNTPSL